MAGGRRSLGIASNGFVDTFIRRLAGRSVGEFEYSTFAETDQRRGPGAEAVSVETDSIIVIPQKVARTSDPARRIFTLSRFEFCPHVRGVLGLSVPDVRSVRRDEPVPIDPDVDDDVDAGIKRPRPIGPSVFDQVAIRLVRYEEVKRFVGASFEFACDVVDSLAGTRFRKCIVDE